MLNELQEFLDYTGPVTYTGNKSKDTSYMGRFTFKSILEFEGLPRVLTIIARGYMYHGKDSAFLEGDPRERLDYVRKALCAWCSVPEDGKRAPDKKWQFQTDFSELHTAFPETNFEAYFGTAFGRKHLPKLPTEVFERSDSGYGVSRYLVKPAYLP